jgi:hypothetical protein
MPAALGRQGEISSEACWSYLGPCWPMFGFFGLIRCETGNIAKSSFFIGNDTCAWTLNSFFLDHGRPWGAESTVWEALGLLFDHPGATSMLAEAT